MAILDPISLEILNFNSFPTESLDIPLFPKNTSLGLRNITLSSQLFVDASDVRNADF